MTATAKISSDQSTRQAPIILFGIDSTGKPKAARFATKHAGLATKAAQQLRLRVLSGDQPKLAEIAAQLPVGRVHATGRMFVPFVRRDLYEKLLAAAANGGSQQQPTSPPPGGTSGQTGGKPPASSPHLPRTWSEIGVGDLVVAYESADEGWYEAIVAEVNGDMLTLRWREYPRQRSIVRHRNRLGLLHPKSPSPQPNKSVKPAAGAKQETSSPGEPGSLKPLPTTWEEIDAGHLILAKTDCPWGSWYEAIATAKAGDELTLRWRDNHGHVGPIKRSRFELALIKPDAI